LESFGKYQLVRQLGSGGMAQVFLAREPLAQGLAKILVIKKIQPALAETPQFRQMFEDEAKIAVNLNHPNIVQTFGYGQIGPTYFLAMEHVEGVDLLRVLNSAVGAGRPLPFGLCAYLGQQVAKALDYAHRKIDEYGEPLGIVHRDVSPQNVLVSWDGMVKLVDFGIARARHVREEEGVVKGKFAYMSPEQAAAQPVDARSDIFSLGIVLWEMCCARPLFGGLKGKQALNAIRAAQVPRPRELDPKIPVELEAILMKALAKRPEDRYASARELHNELGKLLFGLAGREGTLVDSSTMGAFLGEVLPEEERAHSPPPAQKGTEAPAKPAGSGELGADSDGGAQVLAGQKTTSARGPLLSRSRHDQLLPLAERKPVVVVEGELSGLSGLRRQMGESRAREALLDFLRVTEHVAYKHQAHPDRQDERGFTYVLGLPVGTEDDAARAVQLSLALIDALDGISRDLSPPLKLAVGVQRGTALVSRTYDADGKHFEYELLGQTGQIAARLAKEAMPGEVLVGGGVFRVARADWRFEELEAVDLSPEGDEPRGEDAAGSDSSPKLAQRSRVYRLLGARPRHERLADGAGARRLIGRDLELGTLLSVHRAVVELAQARTVVIVGEAGVGKASIVNEFRHKLDPATHLVLRCVGRPSLSESPYSLLTDLTRDLVGVSEEAEPREIKRKVAELLSRLFTPEEERDARQVAEAIGLLLGVKVPGAEEFDASERRHRFYAATRRMQSRLAEGRTLVVIIEDLHWADPQSFEILQGMVIDPLARPVLGIATARHSPRIDLMVRSDKVTTILVGELGPRERAELVQSRLADAASAEGLADQILERAGGNPFYINEIIESLVERGILQTAPDSGGRLRWVKRDEEIQVPTSVEAVVASRLDRLPDDERDAIRRAALLGRVFRVEDVVALMTGPSSSAAATQSGARPAAPTPHGAARSLARLATRGLIAPAAAPGDVYDNGPAAYAFRNLITREVAYDGLPPDTRALLHSVAADRLARSPAYRPGSDDGRLADHLLAAGDRVAAARALYSAGVYARDNAGNNEAFALLTRALVLLPSDAHGERYQLHAEREQILRGWGKRPAQLREVHAMRKHAAATLGVEGRHREAEAFCRLGLLYLDVGKYTAARRDLERALSLAHQTGDALAESEAMRLIATLLMNLGKNGEALEMAGQALAVLCNQTERPFLLARAQALNAVGNVHVHIGRLRDAVSRYAEALVIYRRLGVRRLEAATLNNMGWVFVGLGEYEEALLHYKRSLRLAQEIGDRAGIGVKLANIGQTYSDLGDFQRARRYLGKALEIHKTIGDDPGLADALISLAQVALREHQPDEALARLCRGLEMATATRNRYQEIRAMIYLARCKLDRGEAPEAPASAAAATPTATLESQSPLELARAATRLARAAEIANGEVHALCAEALALVRAGRPAEALSSSTRAVTLLDSGRDVDSVEEVFYIHARAAQAADAPTVARAALGRARAEVLRKARRLRDEEWRARYLGASLAREILQAARLAGLDDSDLSA
jgi:predicted ATPase/class 3 adenylate cyclase